VNKLLLFPLRKKGNSTARKGSEKKTQPSPKPVIILNKRPKGFGQENPKFKRIIAPRDLSLKLSH